MCMNNFPIIVPKIRMLAFQFQIFETTQIKS